MTLNKKLILAGTALTTLFVAGVAMAQSTGTEATEESTVVVVGKRGPKTIDGTLTKETIAKSRSTVTQEFLANQASGQTVLQSINLIPGVNFTNNDPYGNSGGNIRIHGFDGNRISLTFDGAPLNDTGNYAIYSNQQLDAELIDKASVNQGTTDVDSPTASAAGGTVAYTTVRPTKDFGVNFNASLGSFAYRRAFAMVNFGEHFGLTSYLAVSDTRYDKFKGPGNLHKTQFNGRVYKALDNGDFASLSFNYNRNRNNSYRSLTKDQIYGTATAAATPDLDYDATCVNKDTDTNLTDNKQVFSGCSNFYGQRVNPSDTGNLRGQFKYHLMDNLVFTFDPTFQYVLANGGTQFENVKETDSRLDHDGTDSAGVGVDLNNDGDKLDTVTLWRPATTNTHRYGLTTSLIWDINDSNRLRGAYTIDYGRHRQTGEFGYLNADGTPVDVFGGRDDESNAVKDVDRNVLQNRNRFSIAKLEQLALEYRGQFLDNKLTVNIGVRAPTLTRELNNYCYQPSGADFPRCSTEPLSSTPATASGNVFLIGGGTTQYVAPLSYQKEYKKTLPNLGFNYALTDTQSFYMSYAESLSAPRTDNLYKYSRAAAAGSPIVTSIAQPETTQTVDLGYRFQNGTLLLSTAVWSTKFHNRIVSTYDPETLLSADRNVGDVDQYGWDGQVGWQVLKNLSLYGSASYNHSKLLSDLQLTATTFAATKGKKLVETPDWTYGGRVQWDISSDFQMGLQGKYVGERYFTDVNDNSVPAYTVFDLDMRYDITAFGKPGTSLQLNIINLTDEVYAGSLGTTTTGGAATTHSIGAPRTTMMTLKTAF